MATTQQQRIETAFRSSQAALAIPAQTPPPRRQAAPAPQPGVKTRKQIHAAWLGLSLFTSCLILACGMLYLYGCASLAKETLRSSYLATQKKQEQARAEQWQDRRNEIYTSAYIEKKAREYNMIPADDKETIRIAP